MFKATIFKVDRAVAKNTQRNKKIESKSWRHVTSTTKIHILLLYSKKNISLSDVSKWFYLQWKLSTNK
jgi:hypothetical protein